MLVVALCYAYPPSINFPSMPFDTPVSLRNLMERFMHSLPLPLPFRHFSVVHSVGLDIDEPEVDTHLPLVGTLFGLA